MDIQRINHASEVDGISFVDLLEGVTPNMLLTLWSVSMNSGSSNRFTNKGPGLVILLLDKGSCQVVTEGKSNNIFEGTVIVLEPYETLTINTSSESLHYFLLKFDKSS